MAIVVKPLKIVGPQCPQKFQFFGVLAVLRIEDHDVGIHFVQKGFKQISTVHEIELRQPP